MGARSKARKRALDALYEADVRQLNAMDVLAANSARRLAEDKAITHEYTDELLRGVTAHRERIDELLSTYSHGWTLGRMPAVDRGILRIATYELLWGTEVPDAVVLDEAVVLAKDLSTDESPVFINGLLARLLEIRPTLDLSD